MDRKLILGLLMIMALAVGSAQAVNTPYYWSGDGIN